MTYYDAEAWATETVLGRRIFNAGFRMLPGDLAGWELLKIVPMETSEGDGELAYMWQGGNGRELLRIGVAELADWSLAQQRLRDELLMSMRGDIPRGTNALGQVGDIAYAGRDPETDIPASISFVRGNVQVSVRSVGDRIADVSPAAMGLDAALSRPPADPEAEQATVRSLEATGGKAGEEEVVVASIAEAAAGGWLQALAADGELRRSGDRLIYVPGSAGPAHIDLFIRRARPGLESATSH